uniref:Protein root UVB sensitive/RUS domain-containing protein n=1 Tax=Timema shepardi TaxID=629360 RepID=A0A7R9AMB5_TIMSH|nr:unnamed protein product [Timema shepardi]
MLGKNISLLYLVNNGLTSRKTIAASKASIPRNCLQVISSTPNEAFTEELQEEPSSGGEPEAISDEEETPEQNSLVKIDTSVVAVQRSFIKSIYFLFREVFLPQGYPDSVSDDYFHYQVWDTVQAFCSTITGTLATQAIMKGVGVGDTAATPLAASITWIMKDGTGMVGRIVFAWWKGQVLQLEVD